MEECRHATLLLSPPAAAPPVFAFDMTAEERALMGQHVAYARGFFENGKLLAYGPVLDPEASFGMAILAMEDEQEVKDFIANDPTILAGLHHYTYAPMMLGGSQAPR